MNAISRNAPKGSGNHGHDRPLPPCAIVSAPGALVYSQVQGARAVGIFLLRRAWNLAPAIRNHPPSPPQVQETRAVGTFLGLGCGQALRC